jgi:hypothetical protein
MITGAHSILYSTHPDADRAFLRDVLELPSVDVGGGWLIFGLPPSEVAVHPSDTNDVHAFYLLCDDVQAFIAEMKEHGIATSPIETQRWGFITQVTMPGGGKLGVYEPRHARPEPVTVGKVAGRKPVAKKAPKTRAPARATTQARARPAKKQPARATTQARARPAKKTPANKNGPKR